MKRELYPNSLIRILCLRLGSLNTRRQTRQFACCCIFMNQAFGNTFLNFWLAEFESSFCSDSITSRSPEVMIHSPPAIGSFQPDSVGSLIWRAIEIATPAASARPVMVSSMNSSAATYIPFMTLLLFFLGPSVLHIVRSEHCSSA